MEIVKEVQAMIGLIALLLVVWVMFKVLKFGMRAAWSGVKILFTIFVVPVAVLGFLSVGVIGVIILLVALGSIASRLMHRAL